MNDANQSDLKYQTKISAKTQRILKDGSQKPKSKTAALKFQLYYI